MPERLEREVLQKARYINTLTFTLPFTPNIALNLTMTHEFCSTFIRNTVKKDDV